MTYGFPNPHNQARLKRLILQDMLQSAFMMGVPGKADKEAIAVGYFETCCIYQGAMVECQKQ